MVLKLFSNEMELDGIVSLKLEWGEFLLRVVINWVWV